MVLYFQYSKYHSFGKSMYLIVPINYFVINPVVKIIRRILEIYVEKLLVTKLELIIKLSKYE